MKEKERLVGKVDQTIIRRGHWVASSKTMRDRRLRRQGTRRAAFQKSLEG